MPGLDPAVYARRGVSRRVAYLLSAVLLAVSLTASVVAWRLTDQSVTRQRHSRFVRHVDAVRLALQERLRVQLEALHSLRALFELGEVDHRAWATFCTKLALNERFPGLHRLSFNRRVLRAEVAAYEARQRADPQVAALLPGGFAVKPMPHQGLVDAADQLFVIEQCWPPTGDLPLGVDVYADPVRRDVIDRLRGRHEPLATPLVAFYPSGSCFVVMVAVGSAGDATSCRGVLAAVYLPDELLAHALATTSLAPGVELAVHDGAEATPSSRLFATSPAPVPASARSDAQHLEVAGRTWTLFAWTTPEFDAGTGTRWLPGFMLGASLLTGLALATMLFVLATARDRAQALAKQMTAALEAQRTLQMRSDRLRSLGEMAAGMAHELNQPLQGVRGQAEHMALAMDRGWSIAPERLRGMLDAIVAQADRMTHIVDHVRLFAREAGRPQATAVDVAMVAAAAVGMIGAQIRAKGIEVAVDCPQSGAAMVRGNAFSLEEVVINLLTNARDAVEERLRREPALAGPHIVLTVTAPTAEPRRVTVRVADRGDGMPADVQARAFEPFFTTKSPDRGTGLGLSIARALVAEAGGDIVIDSSPAGTTVTFALPAVNSMERP